jgi:uroporphyrinogen-III decarboxylase
MLIIGLNQAGLTLYDHSPATWLGDMALANFYVFNFSYKVDIDEIKAKLGQRVTLMGNMPPLDVGTRGQPNDVIRWGALTRKKAQAGVA